MILNAYTVLDTVVGAFLQPFFARSHGEAIRSFTDAVNDPKAPFHAHPHDFSLYFVGTFNDASGDLGAEAPAKKLISGTEALIKDLPPSAPNLP